MFFSRNGPQQAEKGRGRVLAGLAEFAEVRPQGQGLVMRSGAHCHRPESGRWSASGEWFMALIFAELKPNKHLRAKSPPLMALKNDVCRLKLNP
jgi:hypothetical protein